MGFTSWRGDWKEKAPQNKQSKEAIQASQKKNAKTGLMQLRHMPPNTMCFFFNFPYSKRTSVPILLIKNKCFAIECSNKSRFKYEVIIAEILISYSSDPKPNVYRLKQKQMNRPSRLYATDLYVRWLEEKWHQNISDPAKMWDKVLLSD